jgi:hypothetical protein
MKQRNDLEKEEFTVVLPNVYDAIRNVLFHYLEDEKRDFETMAEAENENGREEVRHVYSDLLCLEKWRSLHDTKFPRERMTIERLIEKLGQMPDLTAPVVVEFAKLVWDGEAARVFFGWVLWMEHHVFMGENSDL